MGPQSSVSGGFAGLGEGGSKKLRGHPERRVKKSTDRIAFLMAMQRYGYRRDVVTAGVPFEEGNAASLFTPKENGDPDLRRFCTPSNQWSLSSCAGNATADAVEILDAVAGKSRVELSRLFVYANARILHQELHRDEGTYISTCFEVLSRFGVCAEDTWPYEESKVFVSPSLKAMREATGHKIKSYYRIRATGKERVNQCIAALQAYCPVVFGTLVSKNLGSHRGEGILNIPTGSDVGGGHAMILVGHDSARKAFILKNSWGDRWGMNGFAYISEDYIAWGNTWDLWVPYGGYAHV